MTAGRGSSSGSSVLAEAIRLGTGRAGIVLLTRDAIVTVGAMIASELYGKELSRGSGPTRRFAEIARRRAFSSPLNTNAARSPLVRRRAVFLLLADQLQHHAGQAVFLFGGGGIGIGDARVGGRAAGEHAFFERCDAAGRFGCRRQGSARAPKRAATSISPVRSSGTGRKAEFASAAGAAGAAGAVATATGAAGARRAALALEWNLPPLSER